MLLFDATTEVFELTADGLKPITTNDLAIGQKVIQAYQGVATITGKTSSGYIVTFDDGRQMSGQTVGALSPYTRIEPCEPVQIEPSDWVNDLLAQADRYKIAQREKQEAEARQKAADVERITAELRAKYPWADSGIGMSGHARAAKNLKQELSIAFRGVKFSVKSERFSGGDSVNIHWTLGPTSAQVEEISGKYRDSHFDGMTDSQVHDSSAYGHAVEKVLGRAMFVSCYRDDPPHDVREKIMRGLCALQRVEYDGWETIVMDSGSSRDQVGSQARILLAETSFPLNFDGDLTVENNEGDGHWAKIVFPAREATSTPAPVSSDGVTVTENEERNGVEIRFASKPAESVRSALKANGFRWSKFQSLWYARRSPQTLAFAHKLAAE